LRFRFFVTLHPKTVEGLTAMTVVLNPEHVSKGDGYDGRSRDEHVEGEIALFIYLIRSSD